MESPWRRMSSLAYNDMLLDYDTKILQRAEETFVSTYSCPSQLDQACQVLLELPGRSKLTFVSSTAALCQQLSTSGRFETQH